MALLDMNKELAQDVVEHIGGGKAKFFEANVLETESTASAVKGAVAWSKETGKEIRGVIAAAGVSTPAKVRYTFASFLRCMLVDLFGKFSLLSWITNSPFVRSFRNCP